MKKYIKRTHCLVKERLYSCQIHQMGRVKEHQKWIDSKMSEADQNYRVLKQDFLNFRTIEDVLSYKFDYQAEKFQSTEILNISATCELEPTSCNDLVKKEEYLLNNKEREMKELKRKLSLHQKLLESLKKRFIKTKDNLVFIFNKDKDEEIICTYFNYEEFNISSINYMHLSHYEVIDPRSSITFSIKDGGLKVIYITSLKEGKNHGSSMLSFLISLIPMFNKKIDEYNQQLFESLHCSWDEFTTSVLYTEKVEYIHGSIGTLGLSEEKMQRLVAFYKRNDLYKDGAIYRKL